MIVYKFGGASVKDAESVRNMATILQERLDDDAWLVVSAMGKTTNALEILLEAYRQEFDNREELFQRLHDFHQEIIDDLFPFSESRVHSDCSLLFEGLREALTQGIALSKDEHYDQVVCFGELLSTRIISAYLDKVGVNNSWVDAREIIHTDARFRSANVDMVASAKAIQRKWSDIEDAHVLIGHGLMLTQGFIGSHHGRSTTLGREGSDYTAAILAWAADADELVIWKDVPGMLNADPKYFPEAERLDSISYREAIELSYYGASVIHPKTLKPLQNKGIPLKVRSFLQPDEPGSVIHHDDKSDQARPSFIFKEGMVLLSIIPKDFSFIMEDGLSEIFALMAKHRLRADLTQNSALSFSVCLSDDAERIDAFRADLSEQYKVLYNQGLSLLTIRHYDDKVIERLISQRDVLVEQRNRQTARYVLRGGFSRPTAD